MPTTVTGYGGMAEIDGNKFLLEDDDLRIFLDFGRLSAMCLTEPEAVPDLTNESSLAFYNDPKSRLDQWEKVTRQAYGEKVVGADRIREQPGNYILACSLWDYGRFAGPGVSAGEGAGRGLHLLQQEGLQGALGAWPFHEGSDMEGRAAGWDRIGSKPG